MLIFILTIIKSKISIKTIIYVQSFILKAKIKYLRLKKIVLDKKSATVALEILTKVYDAHLEIIKSTDKQLAEVCSRENVPFSQVFFAMVLLLIAAFALQYYGIMVSVFHKTFVIIHGLTMAPQLCLILFIAKKTFKIKKSQERLKTK